MRRVGSTPAAAASASSLATASACRPGCGTGPVPEQPDPDQHRPEHPATERAWTWTSSGNYTAGLANLRWAPPDQRDLPAGRDTLARPSAEIAQRLRNPSATPPLPLAAFRENPSRSRLAVLLARRSPLLARSAAAARAQDEDSAAVEKVTKLNKKAVDEYQNLNFEEARKMLQGAPSTPASAVGPRRPPGHRAHLRPPGRRHCSPASSRRTRRSSSSARRWRSSRTSSSTRSLATPEIQEVFDEAVAQQKGGRGGGEKPPAAERPTASPTSR